MPSFSERQKKQDLLKFNELSVHIKDALNGKTGIVSGVSEDNQTDIFYMLCFCLCVPQSKAVKAETAIQALRKEGFHGTWMGPRVSFLKVLAELLCGTVRFHKTKADRLLSAKNEFYYSDFWKFLTSNYATYLQLADCPDEQFRLLCHVRASLIERFRGMGFKVASHFLRNIGMPGLAILDVHILNGMKDRQLLPELFKVTPRNYAETETLFLDYANYLGITGDELDLMFWSTKTGYVFK